MNLDTKEEIIPSKTFDVRKHESGAIEVPQGAAQFNILLDRSTWPDTGDVVIRVDTYASFDGGNTWTYSGGFGARGGKHVRRDGKEAGESGGGIYFTQPIKDDQCRVRVEINPVVSVDSKLSAEAKSKADRIPLEVRMG